MTLTAAATTARGTPQRRGCVRRALSVRFAPALTWHARARRAQGVRRAAAAAAAAAPPQPAPILANSRTAARALDAERAERLRAKAARKRKREVRSLFRSRCATRRVAPVR